MKFEFLTEVLLKIEILRDVTLSGWVSSSGCFEGSWCLRPRHGCTQLGQQHSATSQRVESFGQILCVMYCNSGAHMADDISLKSCMMIAVGQMIYVKCLSAAWFILLVYSTSFLSFFLF